jgi:maltooligosyltrehalose trehalohydrolase
MKTIGPQISGTSCTFTVWAPQRTSVSVHVLHPFDRVLPMEQDAFGYWRADVEGVSHGALYRYLLDESFERPDPASHSQPQGVHGPSMVVHHSLFRWSDRKLCTPQLSEYIIYELHVGAFTPEGTLRAAAERLPALVDLGITAVEIMPVAQFPGARNWGYDGVYPFAVQHSYGGPEGLKAFVDACHRHNLAVVLDVVYNHLGPEGNYLREFGPYFTDRYTTPWGESLNFDGPYSDGVCDFFIANALYWLREYHFDALRLDAVHAICDLGARPFLARLAEAVANEFLQACPPKYLIAESDLNDVRIIRSPGKGGFGLHAQWSDDVHHALHALLTGESRGYYADFGSVEHLHRALRNAFCYAGHYSPARKRTHGNDASGFHTGRFVVCSQNHDQIGNRMLGERLIGLTDFERARLAAAAVLLSPYIPLLFMGEEHGETNPFLYFADHADEELKRAVRQGRKAEFAAFHDQGEPPDPFDRLTFARSGIDWSRRERSPGNGMYGYYRELIRVRAACPAIAPCSRDQVIISRYDDTAVLTIHYVHDIEPAVCVFNFGPADAHLPWNLQGRWNKRFDSRSHAWPATARLLPDTVDGAATVLTMTPFSSAVFTGGAGNR